MTFHENFCNTKYFYSRCTKFYQTTYISDKFKQMQIFKKDHNANKLNILAKKTENVVFTVLGAGKVS
jgi:hypothetical protein